MSESCPIPTPEEKRYIDIQEAAETALWAAVNEALDTAARDVAAALEVAQSTLAPPPRDYFVATIQQKLFITLCGGDPETFLGGDPEIAAHILQNGRNISDHYWTGKDGQER